jgi:GNAT superfamily N-acetyltransferase
VETLSDVLLSVEGGDAAPHLRKSHWEWAHAPSRSLVAYVMGAEGLRVPAACLRLFLRHLTSPGGSCVRCYGVGGVFTADGWRGRGLATALLERAECFARERGAFLALYAVYGRGLYLRSGYVAVAQANETEHLWVRSTDAGLAVLPGTWGLWPEGHF